MDPISPRGSKMEPDESVIIVLIASAVHPQLNHPSFGEQFIEPFKWTSLTLTKKPVKGIQNLPNWLFFILKQTCDIWLVSFVHLAINQTKIIIWDSNFSCLRQNREQGTRKRTASRDYIFAVWAVVRKVASADNRSNPSRNEGDVRGVRIPQYRTW